MYTQALSHSDRLDGVLHGTDSGVRHGHLFDIVLNLMPTGLSAPARIFAAIVVSALVTSAGYYLWRTFIWRDTRWRD